MSGDVKALINHYAREGFYRHIKTVCEEVIKKRGNDPPLQFWHAFGTAMEGGYAEAIRSLEPLRTKRDMELPVAHALIHYHNSSTLPDAEAVSALKASLSEAEERAGDAAFLLTATFMWHIGDVRRARDMVKKVSADNVQALSLAGWIDLTVKGGGRGDVELVNTSINKFKRALEATKSGQRQDLEALTGAARFYEIKREYAKALEALDAVTGAYAWYLPALTQKADIRMQMNEWDQALEFTQRVLAEDAFDVKALRLHVLYILTRESAPDKACEKLSELIDSLDRHEPKNPHLYFDISRAFARLAGRNASVLNLTVQLVERAMELNPTSSAYVTESGYQMQLMGRYSVAVEKYREAAKLDEANVAALHGMIYCQLAEGQLADAEAQLEFLSVIQESIGRTAEVAFLDAMLSWRQKSNRQAHTKFLDETLKLHFSALKKAEENQLAGVASAAAAGTGGSGALAGGGSASGSANSTYDFYVRFNPDFLLEVAQEYLVHCGSEPTEPAAQPSSVLTKARALLQKIVKVVPGLLNAQLLLANARYLTNDFDNASRTLQRCLKLDPTYSDAHLLMAQIGLHQENYRAAMTSLEQALSHNFEVRDSPVYHLVKARVLEAMGDLEEAIVVLDAAMKLPGVRRADAPGGRAAGAGKARKPLSLHDRASIFIKLAEIHTQLDHVPEATKVVSDAMHEFAGSTEEVRVIVANSEIAIKRGDIDMAVRLLSNVPPSSPAYVKAQTVKADIYLKHRRDKAKYAKCYKDLVARNPESEHNHVLLGEAYMRIQMPDAAIEAFEAALKLNPADPTLASKIGSALVSTHDYRRAVEYYETALRAQKQPDPQLRSELTELYVKLGEFDLAGRLLDVALADSGAEDVMSMTLTVRNLVLMSRVHKGNGGMEDAVDALLRALQVQQQLTQRLRSEAPEALREQRHKQAELAFDVAKIYEEANKDTKAMAFYNEALKAHNAHEPSMLALARLYLRRGELDNCQRQCATLMRVDASNEEASMMLADLMFRKNESDAAMYHYQQLLEKKPTHYVALSKVISLMRRAGKLEDAERLIKAAERSSPRASFDPGMRFCKGLYARYTNNPHEAIKEFNAVRQSGEWADAATEHMVEIYLTPDNESLWEEGEAKDADEGIRIAEKLLRELPNRPLTAKQQVLEAYTLIATKNKASTDSAMAKLDEVLTRDRDNVPALLAMSTALMIQKQTPKARNLLKRIAKMQYDQELNEEFVKAWLLLADIYVGSGKYDMAQDLCKRCLSFDRSCAKAWEYMGSIMEKEASYKDASDHYEQAWKFMNEASASIGYKLAFNYLKARRFVEAINVCHKVLAAYPDYPKIRKDVLERARAGLRP